MSVVGFDIGNLNCIIAIARKGGIEVITNDYSLHATPACVAFSSKGRSMGVQARQAVNTNFKNTIINIKHLIGRKYSDSVTQKFIPFIPCPVEKLANDNIGLRVTYGDKEQVFTPEQILAALFTKLKDIIESQLKDVKKVTDCVVSVPNYYTDVQRQALQAAIQYAQLNSLRVMNESTAIALAYGIYKDDLPEETARPRHVVFLDVGHASTQASLVAYNKGALKMIHSTFDLDVGGLWWDNIIREHFRAAFKAAYGIDAKTSPRAWLRLLDESEKVKKQMSANQTPIPINIECFMDDKDVSGHMQRMEFEEIAAPLFRKVHDLIQRLLSECGFKAADVDEIEIVGGSSRIPMIRKIVHDIFEKEPKTTMNQDEAVARGAAMQCAILSPAFRVREFSVKDCQPYSLTINWSGGSADPGESIAFNERDEFPMTKMVTLHRTDAFKIDAKYTYPNTIPHSAFNIGVWNVSGLPPLTEGEKHKNVKVKVKMSPDGIFSVASATVHEKHMVAEDAEKIEQPMEHDANSLSGEPTADGASEAPKQKVKTVTFDLMIEKSSTITYDVAKYAAVEVAMQAEDKKEKYKADAKNSLEEYVYDIRDKLSGSLSAFITKTDADEFLSKLTSTEEWLYDDGEYAEQEVFEQRLRELKTLGDPVVERFREFEARKPAFDAFDQSILRVRRAYEDYVNGGEAHAHLESTDMEKVISAIEDKKRWLDEARHKQERRPKTDVPAVFVHEINQQLQAFENVVHPILNKKKPAPPPKKEEKVPAAGDAAAQPAPSDMEVD